LYASVTWLRRINRRNVRIPTARRPRQAAKAMPAIWPSLSEPCLVASATRAARTAVTSVMKKLTRFSPPSSFRQNESAR
jgi:hypothetical protein